jgi:hypothetical protein
VRVVPGVLRGSCEVLDRWRGALTLSTISAKASRRTTAQGLPGYELCTDVYQTERDGRVDGRVWSAAPLGTGRGRCKREAKQLPRAMERAVPPSNDARHARREPISTQNIDVEHFGHIQLGFPAPRWWRQGNVHLRCRLLLSGL